MLANTIHSNSFTKAISSVNVWNAALHHVQIQAQDTDVNTEIIDFIGTIFQRAKAAGYGEEDAAALIKLFRKSQG